MYQEEINCTSNIEPEIEIDSEKDNFEFSKLTRRDVRSLMFQVLYVLEAYEFEVTVESVIDNFNRGFGLDIPLEGEIANTINAIISSKKELDKIIEKFLTNWRIERLGVCTRLILYLSIWELLNMQTPSSIVINEAVELAKCFTELEAYKFINGILDEVNKNLSEFKTSSN